MGLLSEGINEVIATTRYNAAPMGIRCRDGQVRMVIFTSSHTAQNIERDRRIVANFVFDPVLYVRTAFEDLKKEDFVEEGINGNIYYRLADAEAWAAFTAVIEKRTADVMNVRLFPEKEVTRHIHLHPVNRGFNSVIDATVHATRYAMSHDPALKELIDYHAGIVKRCGGRREQEALLQLLDYLK